MATARDTYLSVCDVLLEPGGLAAGIYSEDDFLSDFREVVADFHGRTAAIYSIVSANVVVGNPYVAVPDSMMRVDHVLYRNRLLRQITAGEMDRLKPGWQSQAGAIEYWHQDRVPLKHIGLYRIPSASESGALKLIGPSKPNIQVYDLDSEIPSLPDSLAVYLKYGVLDRVFGRDGETRDLARQRYCRSRYEEGIAICRSIIQEAIEEAVEMGG